MKKRPAADLHAVAQADGLDGSAAQHGAGQHGHGIGVVQEPGVRADGLHVLGEIQHDGNGAQGTEDSADAQGVRDGLAKAVLLGYLEVDDRGGLVAAHLDGVDHEIRALQRRLAILNAKVAGDLRAAFVEILVQVVQNRLGFLETLAVNVIQGDLDVLQGLAAHAVAQDVAAENGASSTHEGYFGHGSRDDGGFFVCLSGGKLPVYFP